MSVVPYCDDRHNELNKGITAMNRVHRWSFGEKTAHRLVKNWLVNALRR